MGLAGDSDLKTGTRFGKDLTPVHDCLDDTELHEQGRVGRLRNRSRLCWPKKVTQEREELVAAEPVFYLRTGVGAEHPRSILAACCVQKGCTNNIEQIV